MLKAVGSSNGRTAPFGGVYLGSSPSPTALSRNRFFPTTFAMLKKWYSALWRRLSWLESKHEIFMEKIPQSVKDHISNAQTYLDAANKFPSPMSDAIQILLLLTAWENIKIAQEELSAWANKTEPSKKLYKSHAHKFKKMKRPITRVILDKPGKPAQTINYVSERDFEKLLFITRYGPRTGSKNLTAMFEKGWHTDEFRNALINKIQWESTMVTAYEDLPDYGK